jgi:hypothetical protein
MKSDDDGEDGQKTVHQSLLAAYSETQDAEDAPSLRAPPWRQYATVASILPTDF